MFKTINPLATNLGNRLGILHRSFIDINTDLKTLSKSNGGIKNFGHLFNIATKQDIQNFQQFNRVIEDGQNAQRSYNTYLSTAPTSLRQLGSAIVDVKKEQYDLNTAYHQGKISQDEYNNKMQACNTRLQELRGSSNALTLSQKALNTAMRIGSTIANMAFNAAIGIAISAIISVIQKAINAEQELIQKNKELADSYKNNIQALEDYRQKYFDIIDSTDDEAEKDKQLIEWKKQLIEQYGLEEEALAGVNSERRTGIALIDEEAYKEAKNNLNNLKDYEKAINNIYDAPTKRSNLLSYNSMSGLDDYGIDFKNIANNDGSYNVTIEYNTSNAYEQLEQIGNLLSDLKMKSSQLDEDSPNYENLHNYYNWRIKFVQQEYDRIKKIIDDYGAIASSALLSQAQILLHNFITDSTNTAGQLANVVDKTTFESWKKAILNLAGNSEPLKNALEELANSMFPEYSGSVINSTNDTNNAVTAVTSLNDALTKLQEILNDIKSASSVYQSAMKKVTAGVGLTADEVNEILELDPTLFDKFIKQKDGTWTIDLGALQASYEVEFVQKNKDDLGIDKQQVQKERNNLEARLDELYKERDEILNDSVVDVRDANDKPGEKSEWQKRREEELKEINSEISELEKQLDEADKKLTLSSFQELLFDYSDVDRIRDSYDEVVKKIDEYNDGISSLNKAIDTINEGNSLSYDEMTQLIELYPELEGKVIETANGYSIDVNALEDVRTQSYKTRNDYIDDRTAEVAALREDVKQQIEEYKRLAIARIVSENSHGNYVATVDELLENDPEYQSLLLKLELYDEYFNKVVGYKRTVTGNDNSGSSDKSIDNSLQNEIDYYNTLIQAVETLADKQIKALEDEKDALQEKNDEQQRELDLIEAKNNLEKAKKQKVFVYKEGQGLVQVQDERAVADAQKEYDDIQNEIKQAEIDKQIDGWKEYKDQFSNMESNIKDTLTVEQAKKALGTDEKGLLTLDDKTINGIRDGLATATYNKDVEDNKENSKYVTVKLEDFLKSVGATVTPTEFKAMASTITSNPVNIIPATNDNSTVNNAQTINNNRTINSTFQFNIYDATDPQKVANEVHGYLRKLLKETINSTK